MKLSELWLAVKPEQVQRLAKEFPIGSSYDSPDGRMYLVGYGEGKDDVLLMSFTDPCVDYKAAVGARFNVCADCVRGKCLRHVGA